MFGGASVAIAIAVAVAADAFTFALVASLCYYALTGAWVAVLLVAEVRRTTTHVGRSTGEGEGRSLAHQWCQAVGLAAAWGDARRLRSLPAAIAWFAIHVLVTMPVVVAPWALVGYFFCFGAARRVLSRDGHDSSGDAILAARLHSIGIAPVAAACVSVVCLLILGLPPPHAGLAHFPLLSSSVAFADRLALRLVATNLACVAVFELVTVARSLDEDFGGALPGNPFELAGHAWRRSSVYRNWNSVEDGTGTTHRILLGFFRVTLAVTATTVYFPITVAGNLAGLARTCVPWRSTTASTRAFHVEWEVLASAAVGVAISVLVTGALTRGQGGSES